MAQTMRLRVRLDEEDQERAREFAEEKGLRMPRAYGELIQKGLAEDND